LLIGGERASYRKKKEISSAKVGKGGAFPSAGVLMKIKSILGDKGII